MILRVTTVCVAGKGGGGGGVGALYVGVLRTLFVVLRL
jgi:hypothetical protein